MIMALILVVDDSASLRLMMTFTLKAAGHDVIEAADGVDALETAKTIDPALVLTDVNMPNMDGITMLKKLRENEWGKNVKVMILTNLAETGKTASDLKDYGVYEYMVKSDWKLEDIVGKIKTNIKRNVT